MNRLGSVLGAVLACASVAAMAEVPPLVDVAWIKAHACDPDVAVLDIRNELDGHSKTDYLKGHIPCAVHTDYLKDGWRAKAGDVVGQLAPVDKLEKLVGDLGIDNDTHVVIYHAGKDALDLGSATRVYWTFKVLGHDEVSILDGGLAAYTADKANKLERGSNRREPRAFKAALRSEMVATKDDVRKALEAGTPLVDLRPEHQFVGINRHGKAKRSGTIPGAKNLPESWLTENGGGKLRDRETLARLYALAEVPTEGEQIEFCNTGHWASLGWFVSSELLGNKQARLYDGSMVEWSADERLPMETRVNLK